MPDRPGTRRPRARREAFCIFADRAIERARSTHIRRVRVHADAQHFSHVRGNAGLQIGLGTDRPYLRRMSADENRVSIAQVSVDARSADRLCFRVIPSLPS